MSQNHSLRWVEERRTRGKRGEFSETYHRIHNRKMIETVQVCLRCGRDFSFKKGRKRCPCCLGFLRTKTVVLKVP